MNRPYLGPVGIKGRGMGQAGQPAPAVAAGPDPNETFYQSIKKELIPDMIGQFVLVNEQQLVDVFPTYQEAFDAAIEKLGAPPPGTKAPWLIKEVLEQEPIETI